MRDRMIITVSFKNQGNDIIANFKLDSKLIRNESFLAFVESTPTLMDRLFSTIESGGRYLVDNGYIQLESMRKLLEKTTDSSIDAIDKIRQLVKAED